MRFPWRRRHGCPSEDAVHSVEQAQRGLQDAKALHARARAAADGVLETVRDNHFTEAVVRAIRGA